MSRWVRGIFSPQLDRVIVDVPRWLLIVTIHRTRRSTIFDRYSNAFVHRELSGGSESYKGGCSKLSIQLSLLLPFLALFVRLEERDESCLRFLHSVNLGRAEIS